MTTAAARADSVLPEPSVLAVFITRADVCAKLWQCGEIDLHEAVDQLQAAAERNGLVTKIGQDEVQAIMSAAFGIVRDDLASGEEESTQRLSHSATQPQDLCHGDTYYAPVDNEPDPVDDNRARRGDEASPTTVETLMLALRSDGEIALARNRERLIALSPAQVEHVVVRLHRLQSAYPAITDRLIELLAELLP
jgi:hypothetical protein